MFNWVGLQFDAVLSNYVLGVVSNLVAALAPIALSAMTLWVALYGWAVLRNEVSESLPSFLWKTTKIGLVLAVSLQSAFYVSTVSDTANGLALGVATTFLPTAADPATVSTPYALLDKFTDDASAQVNDIMKDASMFRLDLLLAAGIFTLGTMVFLSIALFVVTLSKVFLTFVIAVGPIFVLCLAWRPTARFFDSWLSMLLNAVVLTWFAFFALGLSAYVGERMFLAIQAGGGFLGTTFNALAESMRYCVLMVLMAIICFQAPSLASALTGGAAIQQGVQMAQNVLMVAGLRSRGPQSRAFSPSSQGGTVVPGVGLPFMAGRATAAAGAASMRVARRGYGAVRTAAYRLAAMRGRT